MQNSRAGTMTNLFSKVKGKLTRKEKQAEKIAQNKAPQDVDIAKAPDVRVTDTRPAEPDKPPQGGPPKPVLQAPVQPDPPHGTQKPDLSAPPARASAPHLPRLISSPLLPPRVPTARHQQHLMGPCLRSELPGPCLAALFAAACMSGARLRAL